MAPSHLPLSLSPLLISCLSSRPGTLHDFHSHEIAEQLTLLDAELFYKIEVWRCAGLGAGEGCPLPRREQLLVPKQEKLPIIGKPEGSGSSRSTSFADS